MVGCADLHSDKDDDKIQSLFQNNQFPDVHVITEGEIMLKCWLQQYDPADECLTDLRRMITRFAD